MAANGRLDAKVVEGAIAEGSNRAKGEEVYVKATGRAIPKALEVGNWFQKEEDCGVRVEIGSTMAIDDIDVEVEEEGEGQDAAAEADEEEEGDKGESMDVDGEEGGEAQKSGKTKAPDEEIPETRIRTLSTVTVAIWLK